MKRKEILRKGILIASALTLILAADVFAQPAGKVVNKKDDIVGIWETLFQGSKAYMQYNADGTLRLATTIEDLKKGGGAGYNGTYSFEGDVYSMTEDAGGLIGKYEVRITKEGGIDKLSFTIIDEPNELRGKSISAGMTRVKP